MPNPNLDMITDALLLADTADRGSLGKPVDPHVRLETWLAELQWLWSTIEVWVQPATSSGRVVWAMGNGIEIHEEHLGHYQAQTYDLSVGSHILAFRPGGSMVAGSRGWVDILGGSRSAALLLLDGEHEWMIGPRTEMKALTAVTFASLLSDLLT